MDAGVALQVRDRRNDVRLSRGMRLHAVLLDRYGQPIGPLRDAQAVDVSARGLAVATTTRVRPGAALAIRTVADAPRLADSGSTCKVRVLAATEDGRGGCTLHCVLAEGLMPAALIYNWAA